MARETKRILPIVIITHLAILVFMVLAHLFSKNPQTVGTYVLRTSLTHFDAHHYLAIAKSGYQNATLTAFFPMFPFFLTFLSMLHVPPLYAALAVVFACHIVGSVYFYKVLRLDFSEDQAKTALYFFLIFPTAFYTVTPYSESIFLLFCVLSYYMFRQQRFFWAGVCGFFTVMSRPPGLAVLALLWAEYVFEMRSRVPWKKVVFALLFPAAGFLVVLFLNDLYCSDPLAFLHKQQEGWGKRMDFTVRGLYIALQDFLYGRPFLTFINGVHEIIGGALIWISTLYAIFRLRKAWAAFAIATCIICTFSTKWMSELRYALLFFPLYMLTARVTRNDIIRYSLTALSLLYLAVLAGHYARGSWVQ